MVETVGQPRRRAPGMSPEDRRAMIVRAALPLVAEFGGGVTTQQIARAAGIGEATVFRAFEDKAALLRACMIEAVRPEHLEEAFAGIAPDLPLPVRLTAAAEALIVQSGRVGSVVEALVATGSHPRANLTEGRRHFMAHREAATARTSTALVELIGPDAARLRLPVEESAHAFQFFVLSLTRGPGGRAGPGHTPGAAETADVVDLFLNGALTRRDAC